MGSSSIGLTFFSSKTRRGGGGKKRGGGSAEEDEQDVEAGAEVKELQGRTGQGSAATG
jgi:hypothetical protein